MSRIRAVAAVPATVAVVGGIAAVASRADDHPHSQAGAAIETVKAFHRRPLDGHAP